MPASAHIPLLLSQAPCGKRFRIVSLEDDCPDCARLREMGFHENAEIRKISDTGALLCQVGKTRLGLSRAMGTHIRVAAL